MMQQPNEDIHGSCHGVVLFLVNVWWCFCVFWGSKSFTQDHIYIEVYVYSYSRPTASHPSKNSLRAPTCTRLFLKPTGYAYLFQVRNWNICFLFRALHSGGLSRQSFPRWSLAWSAFLLVASDFRWRLWSLSPGCCWGYQWSLWKLSLEKVDGSISKKF